MLNNRQAGRRRGRGGQRPQTGGGRGQETGNRIDSRARGNAPQLLEKYKTLARDSQMQGDRVMTEYYLQFADHYFRVTAEMRARYEENRRQRDDWQGEDGDESGYDERPASADGGEGDDDGAERGYEAQRRPPQQQQNNRDRNNSNNNNRDRGEGGGDRNARNGRDYGNRDDGNREGNRDYNNRDNGYRRNERAEAEHQRETIDVNVLPPAFGSDGPMSPIADRVDIAMDDDTPAEAAPRRRGRPRKVVAEGEGNQA